MAVTVNGAAGGAAGKLGDSLVGDGEDDFLDGKAGADTAEGGAGDDLYLVDNANDEVREKSGEGLDTVEARVTFTLGQGQEVELLRLLGTGNLGLDGNELSNTLLGNAGRNRLDGGGGADVMAGGRGDDSYVVDSALDRIEEAAGEGSDLVMTGLDGFELGENLERLTLLGTARIGRGNTLSNIIVGNGEDNILVGREGNDRLDGNAGRDLLDGGDGRDEMRGGAGDDTYLVDDARDNVIEAKGAGTDRVISAVAFRLGSTLEHLTLVGEGVAVLQGVGNRFANEIDASNRAGAVKLNGGGGDDTLLGSALVGSTLSGGAGADRMTGGKGDDLFFVDSGGDEVREADGGGTDRIVSTLSIDLAIGGGGFVENVTLTGKTAAKAFGTAFDNHLVGNARTNELQGLEGDDTLDGGAGADALIGGEGDDTYVIDSLADTIVEDQGKGTDTVRSTVSVNLNGAARNGVLALSAVEHAELLGRGNRNVTGSDAANDITGNAGRNRLEGGAGDDTLEGGAGADALEGGDDFDIARYARSKAGVIVDLSRKVGFGGDAEGDLLSGIEGVIGSAFTDILRGTDDANLLLGGGGGDMLSGGGGADTLSGGAGRNTLFGGQGGDVFRNLGEGEDLIVDFDAAEDLIEAVGRIRLSQDVNGDTLVEIDRDRDGVFDGQVIVGGAAVADVQQALIGVPLEGEDEDDLIEGSERSDSIFGLGGNDSLFGFGGGDILDGGIQNDEIAGGAGKDRLVGGAGADKLDGGEDVDTADYSASPTAVDIDLERASQIGGDADGDELTSIEILVGSGSDDRLKGDTRDNLIDGGAGDDLLEGGGGADTLIGGTGSNHLMGGADADVFDFTGLLPVPTGADAETDRVLDFTAGDDTFAIGAARKVVVSEAFGFGVLIEVHLDDDATVDRVVLVDGATVEEVENAIAVDDPAVIAPGNARLVGTDAGETLDGRAGVALIQAFGGDDFVTGGTENEVIDGGAGNDRIDGGDGNDVIDGGTGSNTLSGGVGLDIFDYSGIGKLDPGVEAEADEIADLNLALDAISLGGGVAAAVASANNDDAVIDIDVNRDGIVDRVVLVLNATATQVIERISLGLGSTVTLSDVPRIVGTDGYDVLEAPTDDVSGCGKADRLGTGAGNDTSAGGPGVDVLVSSVVDGTSGIDAGPDLGILPASATLDIVQTALLP